MKKIYYSTLFVAGLMSMASCDDFLEEKSPSTLEAADVFKFDETANAALIGVYEAWRAAGQGDFFGDGVYYASEVCGSDIERHPEKFTNQPARHYPESFYQNGTYTNQYNLLGYLKETNSPYSHGFDVVAPANIIIKQTEALDDVQAALEAGEANTASQMYGEAVCARAAAYREMVRFMGDVPLVTADESSEGLVSRYVIYDQLIEQLETVIPVMYRVGENANMTKNKFSRTFAEGLLGRICLDAAGYQTRRSDMTYTYGDGTAVTFEDMGKVNASADNAKYGRPDRWKDYVAKAKVAFKAVIDNPGSATFYTADPRKTGSAGQVFDNPYQYFFQQMNNLEYADESINEYAMTQGTGNDARPYSFGRVSSGGGSNNFPCKAYGQGRINPAFYWGVFDPNDKRRDVSVCVTGSTGKGAETLIPFTPGSKSSAGGLTLNKWDENRMANPYALKQRTSGINGPYMRMAEMYLGYAEACAWLGEDGEAKTYLALVRERSFPEGKANTDAFITSCGSMLKAVVQERGFEYAGEGDRRWTLIRTGLVGEAIQSIKELTEKMIAGLEADGYYTFDNGNQISAYVWTKQVDAKDSIGYRLTTQCPEGMEDDPIRFPGWRGQNDDWSAAGIKCGVTEANIAKNLTAGNLTNLAIKGLFKYIDPAGAEAAALEAQGYTKTEYGKQLVDNKDEYSTYLFFDYDYETAPVYLWPLTPNVILTSGGTITNGYGFKQE
ncbi:MAG: RagB/SusD family nutrient uptake outer membrane protein [Bacteroidales bacterium]|nr:RagB/SusD family nutrient uptake outer membrane protein [Bacteroidales bacterium]